MIVQEELNSKSLYCFTHPFRAPTVGTKTNVIAFSQLYNLSSSSVILSSQEKVVTKTQHLP